MHRPSHGSTVWDLAAKLIDRADHQNTDQIAAIKTGILEINTKMSRITEIATETQKDVQRVADTLASVSTKLGELAALVPENAALKAKVDELQAEVDEAIAGFTKTDAIAEAAAPEAPAPPAEVV